MNLITLLIGVSRPLEGDSYVESLKLFVDRIAPRWTANGNPRRHAR